MILLDTTILIYAVGVEHPLRDPCRALIEAVGADRVSATTTVEAIQEFAHVRARRRGREDAIQLAEQYATLLSPLVAVDADDLTAGLGLFGRIAELGSFDAVLAATARRRAFVTAIASADRAFGAVPDLRWLDPADPDFTAAMLDQGIRSDTP